MTQSHKVPCKLEFSLGHTRQMYAPGLTFNGTCKNIRLVCVTRFFYANFIFFLQMYLVRRSFGMKSLRNHFMSALDVLHL